MRVIYNLSQSPPTVSHGAAQDRVVRRILFCRLQAIVCRLKLTGLKGEEKKFLFQCPDAGGLNSSLFAKGGFGFRPYSPSWKIQPYNV